MENGLKYKVLWVDDETMFVDSTQQIADDYDIYLDHYTNWQEAEVALKAHFNEYSAIILDANCKTEKDAVEGEGFLIRVTALMEGIFGRKQEQKPWYILSAGTMRNFETIVGAVEANRKEKEAFWGRLLYLKDTGNAEMNVEAMFANIQRVAANQPMNVALDRHPDVFEYIGEGKPIDGRARQLLLEMLCAVYSPSNGKQYQITGNAIRQVVELLFWGALNKNLLPREFLENARKPNLLESSRFMCGLDTRHFNGARWGQPGSLKDGAGGDTIFPKAEGDMLKNILTFANADSHTAETEEKDVSLIGGKVSNELYFGYVFQLCHLIRWFGHYVELHPDVDANLKMHNFVKEKQEDDDMAEKIATYNGKEGYAERDDNSICHIGECKLNITTIPSCKLKLRDVRLNNDAATKSLYPLFAYYDMLKD